MITGGYCDKCGVYLDWVADNEWALCFTCEEKWKEYYKKKMWGEVYKKNYGK